MRVFSRLPSKERFGAYLTTTEAWVLPKEESAIAPENIWTNRDLDPVPEGMRTWTPTTFVLYWMSDLVSAGTWAAVAGLIALGLTWWECVLAVLVGGTMVALVITGNGIIGATLHTPFAITSRAAYGYHGAKFAVISRMIIACFWMSINTYQAGIFLQIMISSIWPSFNDFANKIPASQGTTSAYFLCFFLFWLLQLPLILIHPTRLKKLFIFKAIVVPATAIGMFIWSRKTGLENTWILQTPGAPRFIAFMYAVTSTMGIWSTMSVSIGDFSRYCKSPNAAWSQLVAIPLLMGTLAVLGTVTAFAASGMYGKELWQPYDIIAYWQVSGAGRFAAFMASAAWAIGNMTTNITANSISASTDLVSLCPKYINIFRGQLFVAVIGVWAFAPWKVLVAASNFLTFMASYSIVLAPMASIMIADYYIVKSRKMDVTALYDPHGRYRFSNGWNWRAFVALIVAIGPNLPGMINAIQPSISIGNIRYIYMISNIWGIVRHRSLLDAVTIYVVLSKVFPEPKALIDKANHNPLSPAAARMDQMEGGDNGSNEKISDADFNLQV